MAKTSEKEEQPTIAIPEIGPYEWTLRALSREIGASAYSTDFRMAGFFGPWGSGKTTLLSEVRRKVSELQSKGKHQGALELFDAWDARDDENLPLAILAHLVQPDQRLNWYETLQGSRFKKIRTKLLTSMSTVLRGVRGTGVADIQRDEAAAKEVVWGEGSTLHSHAEQRARRALLNESLQEAESALLNDRQLGGGSLMVAIDNLDRCSPTKLVEVLESLHNFTGLTRVRFLLVGDEDAIIESIRSRYPTLRSEGARAYLEKVVSPIFRMPNLRDDEDGLRHILVSIGLKDCAEQTTQVSGRTLDQKTLFKFCRFVFDGNPRKALHLFRSLPPFAGQWNYGTRAAAVSGCGAEGILLRWTLQEYAPKFLDDMLAVPNRVKSVGYTNLDSNPEQLEERINQTLKAFVSNLPNAHTLGFEGKSARLAVAALVVCRNKFPDNQQGIDSWQEFVSAFQRM